MLESFTSNGTAAEEPDWEAGGLDCFAGQPPTLGQLAQHVYLALYTFFQQYFHSFAHFVPDCLPYVCLHRQLMCAVTERHERASKWMTINYAFDLTRPRAPKNLTESGQTT